MTENVADPRHVIIWTINGAAYGGLGYGDRLVEQVEARGHKVDRYSLTKPPPTVPHVDHHIISSGDGSVLGGEAWAPPALAMVEEMLTQARKTETTVFGVCLGAQLIAQALWPGSVVPGPVVEAGMTELTFRGSQVPRICGTFHREQITRAAVEGGWGQVMATNGDRGVQAFRFGTRVGGAQFHPELSPDDMLKVIDHHQHVIGTLGAGVEDARRSVEDHRSKWAANQLAEVVTQVIPRWSDPPVFRPLR